MNNPIPIPIPPPSFVQPASDFTNYAQLFAGRVGASDFRQRIAAAHVQPILLQSNLPTPVLAQIWSLADTSSQGALSLPEFCLALALAKRALASGPNQNQLPPQLPNHIRNEVLSLNIQLGVIGATPTTPATQPLQPMATGVSSSLSMSSLSMPSNAGTVPPVPVPALAMQSQVPPMYRSAPTSINNSLASFASAPAPTLVPTQPTGLPTPVTASTSTVATGSLALSAMTVPGILASLPAASSLPSGNWLITPDEKQKYLSLFKSWDTANVGYLSGEQCRDIFSTSGLPTNLLQHIWSLADIHNAGKLNSDEFAIAMHLIYKKLNNVDLPTRLPQELVPASHKELDSTVTYMRDRVVQQMLADKVAAANSPSWVRTPGSGASKSTSNSTEELAADSAAGYVSRHRRRQGQSQQQQQAPTDPAAQQRANDLRRQIDQARELLTLKREQALRLRVAQGKLEDPATVRAAHAKVGELQRVLKSLKAQFDDKVRRGIEIGGGDRTGGADEAIVKQILDARKKLNDVQLKVFKVRDMKRFKYPAIPERKEAVNIASLLAVKPAGSSSPALSDEERRRQKAAEMLAQRMAALNVSSASASSSSSSTGSTTSGGALTQAQQEAVKRIEAEEARLGELYKELESKLKALVDPDATRKLLDEFSLKMALVDELCRKVELPEAYAEKQQVQSQPQPQSVANKANVFVGGTDAKPVTPSPFSKVDLFGPPKKTSTSTSAPSAAPQKQPDASHFSPQPASDDVRSSTAEGGVKTLANTLFGSLFGSVPPPAASHTPASSHTASSSTPAKPSVTDLKPIEPAARRMSTDWLSQPASSTASGAFAADAKAPAVPPVKFQMSPMAPKPRTPSPARSPSSFAAASIPPPPPTPPVMDAVAVVPTAPTTGLNPFATIGRPANSPPSPAQPASPASAPAPVVPQLNNPFDPFASPITSGTGTASDVLTAPEPASPAAPAVLYKAWALYDFEPSTPDDLALKEGQSMDVVEVDGDWVRAVTRDGKNGWVPLTYISRDKPESRVPALVAGPGVAAASDSPGAAAYMLYAYTATQDDELTVEQDAHVEIVDDTSDPDWWLVRCGDRQGLVPATYVERGTRPAPILHRQSIANTFPPATITTQTLHDPFVDPFSSSSSSPDTQPLPPLAVNSATSTNSTPSFLFPSSTSSSRPSSPDRFVTIPPVVPDGSASARATATSTADWLAVPSLRHKASAQSISSQATTWSSTMYPKLVESLAPGERARQEAIFELVKTEQAYVRDLQVVMDVFIHPLAHGAAGIEMFGEDRVRKQVAERIFGPWEEILVTNVAFLSDLELRQEMDDGLVGKPGEVVLEHISAMKCYLPFCASQKAAVETLTKLMKDNALFAQFLSQRQADPRCRSLDLGSYLLKPMQRLTRYPLLIKQILHHTPDTHSDHATLLASLQDAEKVLYEVNEAVRDKEDKVKFAEIAAKVDLRLGSNVLDLRSSTKHLGKRHFIHEGPLAKAKSGRALFGYLFNDIFLLCEERRSERGMPYSVYRAPIPLNNVKVERDAARADIFSLRIDGVDTLQEVAGAGGLLAFKCDDQSSRNNWANKIDAASNAARAAASARGAGAAEIMARPTLGTLQVTVVEGTHCRPVDPSVTRVNLLCEVSLPNETQRTRMVRNTTHPVWNQTLTLSVQSLDDVLRIVVFNSHDKYSEETYMGTAELPLHILEYYGDKQTTQDLPLQNVPSGSVVRIKIQYRSLSRVRK